MDFQQINFNKAYNETPQSSIKLDEKVFEQHLEIHGIQWNFGNINQSFMEF